MFHCWKGQELIKQDIKKLTKEFLIFDDIIIETCKWHYWKHPVKIKYVHIDKILIPMNISFNKTCFNPFTPGRYPTWLKNIKLAFCNSHDGVKTISKESFPYVT